MVKLIVDNIYCGSSYVLNGFMVLDTINIDTCVDPSMYVANSNNDVLSESIL